MSRRKKKKKRNLGDVELNLTAMLDMAFQLLAFFIFTFKPAPVEGEISLHVPPPRPTTNLTSGKNIGSNANDDSAVKGLNTLHIQITGDANGNIDKMFVGETSIANIKVLEGKIRADLANPGNGFEQVIISVGPTLHYQGLMQVVEICTGSKLPNGELLSKMSFVEGPSNEK